MRSKPKYSQHIKSYKPFLKTKLPKPLDNILWNTKRKFNFDTQSMYNKNLYLSHAQLVKNNSKCKCFSKTIILTNTLFSVHIYDFDNVPKPNLTYHHFSYTPSFIDVPNMITPSQIVFRLFLCVYSSMSQYLKDYFQTKSTPHKNNHIVLNL